MCADINHRSHWLRPVQSSNHESRYWNSYLTKKVGFFSPVQIHKRSSNESLQVQELWKRRILQDKQKTKEMTASPNFPSNSSHHHTCSQFQFEHWPSSTHRDSCSLIFVLSINMLKLSRHLCLLSESQVEQLLNSTTLTVIDKLAQRPFWVSGWQHTWIIIQY